MLNDISSRFRRMAGACDVRWRVEEKPETRKAHGGTCDVKWMPESRVL